MADLTIPGTIGYAATDPTTDVGGSRNLVTSGNCSGTAYTHQQDLTVYYEITTVSQPAGTWLPTATSVSGLKLSVFGNTTDSLDWFSTSATDGSGCANAANMRQGHNFSISSTTGSVGMGTQGAIYTTSAGIERRWTQVGDTESSDNRIYLDAWYPLGGLAADWNNNDTLSAAVARAVIGKSWLEVCNIRKEGLHRPKQRQRGLIWITI